MDILDLKCKLKNHKIQMLCIKEDVYCHPIVTVGETVVAINDLLQLILKVMYHKIPNIIHGLVEMFKHILGLTSEGLHSEGILCWYLRIASRFKNLIL